MCLDVQRYECFLSVGGGDCLGRAEKKIQLVEVHCGAGSSQVA